MQREGRLIDFLQEDVTSFSDEEVGAAARVVHEGCKRGLKNHVVLEPVRSEDEGAAIELPKALMPTAYASPVTWLATHRIKDTWPITAGRLKSFSSHLSDEHDPRVLAPAEIEL